ncbi:hypothetical protein ACOI1C_04195 [Bacillus sp. DJP31]|uniref:hypothetical protein n=1 Tax=Bacillus sp. DJP31 TaxID=3409789 RepID=UPI003BB7D3E6
MPIRNVTRKRKGKASKRNTTVSMTRTVRSLRAAFFILIGLVAVFIYFSYENGSLIKGLQSMNLAGFYQTGVVYVQENLLKVAFFIISNLVLLWAGYVIGKKRRYRE